MFCQLLATFIKLILFFTSQHIRLLSYFSSFPRLAFHFFAQFFIFFSNFFQILVITNFLIFFALLLLNLIFKEPRKICNLKVKVCNNLLRGSKISKKKSSHLNISFQIPACSLEICLIFCCRRVLN